jgi:hypothetical protein
MKDLKPVSLYSFATQAEAKAFANIKRAELLKEDAVFFAGRQVVNYMVRPFAFAQDGSVTSWGVMPYWRYDSGSLEDGVLGGVFIRVD